MDVACEYWIICSLAYSAREVSIFLSFEIFNNCYFYLLLDIDNNLKKNNIITTIDNVIKIYKWKFISEFEYNLNNCDDTCANLITNNFKLHLSFSI